MKTICFYARVPDKKLFDIVEFYRSDIEILESLGFRVVRVNTLAGLLRTRFDLYYAWWFGYGILPTLLGRLRGKPVIVSGAVHTPCCGDLYAWPLHKRWLMMLTLKWANRTLFISETDRARLAGFRATAPITAYCAVDLDKYRHGEGERKKQIVSITHLTKENVKRKMLLESIEAFSRFARSAPDFRYLICGSFDDAVDDIRAKISECGVVDQIELTGRISDEQKIAYLQSAWAYLQPSTCEGFGLAILEALACGTPVVTSPEQCIREINGNAVMYGNSVAELSSALTSLVNDPSLYREMQVRGLARVQAFSIKTRRTVLQQVLASL